MGDFSIERIRILIINSEKNCLQRQIRQCRVRSVRYSAVQVLVPVLYSTGYSYIQFMIDSLYFVRKGAHEQKCAVLQCNTRFYYLSEYRVHFFELSYVLT